VRRQDVPLPAPTDTPMNATVVTSGRSSCLRPVLGGTFWLLGPNPAFSAAHSEQECVDHHAFRSSDGAWHLWGCIRGTSVGRVLYHWEGEALAQGPWRATGEYMRSSRGAGESLRDVRFEEWLQSPFVVSADGSYYMFYGGHGTGATGSGSPVARGDPRVACQICLMTSSDGRMWVRHQGTDGYSRLFTGPGEARDPCVLRIGDEWAMYYAGYHDDDPAKAGFYARTSANLVDWSSWRLVHLDRRFGAGSWDTECPHVVHKGGSYYLFRTQDYAAARTHVFRSDDPFDFGIGDARDKYVGPLPVAAPEVVADANGDEYVTSNHDLRRGTMIARLRWVAA